VSRPLWVTRLGTVPYEEARRLQESLARSRQAGEIEDVLLILEHHPVYTRGRRSEPGELPMGEEWYRLQGIEVAQTDRGGRVTYHGPGQIVAYPVVSLRPLGDDVQLYVRRMEEAMIAALGDHGVGAGTITGLTGVWTASGEAPPPGADADGVAADVTSGVVRKIGSIGVHVSRGVTTHGLAVNVNNDLQPFEWIVPCGIDGCRMTSLSRELGAEQDLGAFASTLVSRFAASGDWSPEERGMDAIAGALGAGAGADAGAGPG
jgi:lipoyl(octanoyl) transferase